MDNNNDQHPIEKIENSRDFSHNFMTNILNPFVLYGIPILVLILLLIKIYLKFYSNYYSGFKSLTAALLPLAMVNFLFLFHREFIFCRFKQLKISSAISISFGLGFSSMFLASLSAKIFNHLPLQELGLSTCLAILILGHSSFKHSSIFAVYYGTTFGFLLYIAMFGLQ